MSRRAAPIESEVDPALRRHLPAADFSDCFRLAVSEPGLDAPEAARRIMERTPEWVNTLMRLRNLAVAPFGLKTGTEETRGGQEGPEKIGTVIAFPVISRAPEEMVLGFNDRHLDFRIVVTASETAIGTDIALTTLVATHNLLGRSYLATILPFHRRIVPAMLSRVVEA